MKQLSQVEIGRMRQLADLLEAVPPSSFTLDDWEAQPETPAKTMLFGLIELEPACGFSGCAMGWAAHSGLFPGLSIDDGVLVYRGYSSFRAAAKVMGVTENVAHFLFDPSLYEDACPEPGDVAERLRRFADKVERRLMRKSEPTLRLVAQR